MKKFLGSFAGDRRGNVAIVAAMSMPVLVGFVGLGAETASWYGGKRAQQNAADSAAIAAATNGSPHTYDDEARAVAARYGFRHGVDGVTIATSNTAPCPGGGNTCYSVTIDRLQPVLLAQIVGFRGDAVLDGSPAKRIAASAVATRANAPREYCVLALATSGDPEALRTNGAPHADLSGCSVMSNSNARCNGHDLKATYGDAFGTNNGCGKKQNSNVPKLPDPYAGLKSNIPANPCSSYPRAPEKKKDSPLPSENMLSAFLESDEPPKCGDVVLSGPLLVTDPNTVLVIFNGRLDLGPYKIETLPGASLTIVFTGSDNSREHAPIGKGVLDIEAPTTGPWKGVAMYQDPALTGGVDIDEAGNSPTWNITGLVYLPRASVTFSGAVNKSSNGASCFALVVDNLLINGTGSILAQGGCEEAGLTLPQSQVPTRGELVL